MGNVKRKSWLLVVVAFLFFLFIFPSINAASESVRSIIYMMVTAPDYYLVPYIFVDQHLDKGDAKEIIVKVWIQNLTLPTTYFSAMSLYNQSTVKANITTPSHSVTEVNFTNLNNGSYNYTYTFSEEGTYKIDVKASYILNVYTKAFAYVYVGKFLIYAEIVGGTEYKGGHDGEIDVYVEDSDGNPILGGSGNVTIYYPNKSIFLQNNPLTEIANGMYYMTFTVPFVNGVYISFLNFTSGANSDTDSETFHVSESEINYTAIQEYVWNYTERVLTYYRTGIISVTETPVGGYVNRTYFSCHPNHILANETPEDDAKMYKYAWMEQNIFIEELPSNISYAEVCLKFKREGNPTGNVTIYLNDKFLANHTIDAEPTYYHWDCINVTNNITVGMEFKLKMPSGLNIADNYNWGLDSHETKGFSHYSTTDPAVWEEYTNGEFIMYIKIESYDIGTGEAVWTYENRTLTNYEIYIASAVYNPGESVQIVATLTQAGAGVGGKNLSIDVYYPNGATYISTNMTSKGSGVYIYNLTAPSITGDYRVVVDYGSYVKTTKFTVSTTKSIMETEHEETRDEMEDEIRRQTKKTRDFVTELQAFLQSNFMLLLFIIMVIIIIVALIVIGRKVVHRKEEEPVEEYEAPLEEYA